MEHSFRIRENILSGLFLCSTEPGEILAALKPEWIGKANLSLYEKSTITGFQLQSVFPWKHELSPGIDYEKFCESHLIQPDLFLRVRPGKGKSVRQKLRAAGIGFKIISETCLALPNATKLDSVLVLDEEAVVQDYSSQRVGEFLPVRPGRSDRPVRVWDCCAGSGGKSILAYDTNPAIQLAVSDVRESILANLRKRFKRAGIKKYTSLVIDLSAEKQISAPLMNLRPSIIIADVPCTGSGTWARTPEQRYFFDESKIDGYAAVQKRIVANAVPYVEAGGYLLYITCSVFKKENEEVVKFMQDNFKLMPVKMDLLKGYDKKADTLFAALLQKPL